MASLTPSGSCSDPVISRAFIISVRFLCGGQQYQHATNIQLSQENVIPTDRSLLGPRPLTDRSLRGPHPPHTSFIWLL